jgi:8-oxo-dGTP pyrophosphatase MutT (NUDIX family)
MDMASRNGARPRGEHIVAVAALIVRRDDTGTARVLALRRAADNRAGPGLWETLSGRVEQGEEPRDAVLREIDEECGLKVALDSRPYESYAATRRGLPMIVILYRAHHLDGEVVLSAEHDAYAWLSVDEFRARSTLTKLADVVARALAEPL